MLFFHLYKYCFLPIKKKEEKKEERRKREEEIRYGIVWIYVWTSMKLFGGLKYLFFVGNLLEYFLWHGLLV